MTGKEMYLSFNQKIGFRQATDFEHLPPIYADAWNQLAAEAGQPAAEDTVYRNGEAYVEPPPTKHRPARVEVPSAFTLPPDYVDITTSFDDGRGIRVGILRVGR